MARKSTNFILGLFVIIGVVLGVIAIIWVGATSYFQKGDTYITYFDESVTGLQLDSAVKYRGVDKGRVEKIRVAPDNRLIGVVMKINLPEAHKDVVAQLNAAGITGVKYIDLDRKKPGDPDLSPKLNFPSEYPIIASKPSELQRLLSGVNAIVEKFDKIDTKAMSDQIIATTKAIENFFQGKEMTRILAKLEGTSANLDKITGRVDQAMAAGKFDEVLKDTREAIRNANILIVGVREDLAKMKLPETVGKTRAVAREAEAATENLRRASETLEKFLERVYERPPDLLFGKPPQKRWNE